MVDQANAKPGVSLGRSHLFFDDVQNRMFDNPASGCAQKGYRNGGHYYTDPPQIWHSHWVIIFYVRCRRY
jgi:hypothetical protein